MRQIRGAVRHAHLQMYRVANERAIDSSWRSRFNNKGSLVEPPRSSSGDTQVSRARGFDAASEHDEVIGQ